MEDNMENEEVNDPQALLAAYRKAQADLVELRDAHKALQDQMDSVNEDKYKPRALTAEARLALQGQGIKDADRLMKYLNVDGLDFDEEGNVAGLSERLDALKADLPELFDVKRQVGGRADIFKNAPVETEETASQRQVRALFGE